MPKAVGPARNENRRELASESSTHYPTPVRPAKSCAITALVFAATLLAALPDCNVYDPGLLEPNDAGPPPGSGIGWWSKPGADGCFSAGIPVQNNRPRPQDPSEIDPLYFALESMRLGARDEDGNNDPDAWQSMGFDLDGTCTLSGTCDKKDQPLPCQHRGSATPFDGNYCRDNAFGRLSVSAQTIPDLASKYGFSEKAFNCALCIGAYNFIVRLTRYNGTEIDDDVRVDFYPSPGLETPIPWQCKAADEFAKPATCFLSDMRFSLQSDLISTSTSTTPPSDGSPHVPDALLFDDNAYVRDGYLVTTLPPGAFIWFPGKSNAPLAFPIVFEDATIVGKIGRGQDGTWRIVDGTIGGRSTLDHMLESLRLIGFCATDPNYGLMDDFLKSNLDSLANGRRDPQATCDALSIGIAFTARQARPGDPKTVEPLVECPPVGGGGPADAGAD